MTKTNYDKQAVADYHAKLLNLATVKVPNLPVDSDLLQRADIKELYADHEPGNYRDLIKLQADAKGLSLNAYLLSLVEADMNISIPRGVKGTALKHDYTKKSKTD